jgi:hypothetical protein
VALGALAGKPGVAGAGLLGMSQETVSITWPEVCRLKVHLEARVISLMNSWRVVFRLYCTPENFSEVLAAVQGWVEQGRHAREKADRRVIPRVWWPQVLLSLAAVAAGIFLTALPLKLPAALKVAVTLTALLLVWLPWRRFLGTVVLVLAASLALLFLGQALETHQLFQEADVREWARQEGLPLEKVPEWALFKKRQYERFDTGDWVGAGLGGLGLLFFGWLGLSRLRGPGSPVKK